MPTQTNRRVHVDVVTKEVDAALACIEREHYRRVEFCHSRSARPVRSPARRHRHGAASSESSIESFRLPWELSEVRREHDMRATVIFYIQGRWALHGCRRRIGVGAAGGSCARTPALVPANDNTRNVAAAETRVINFMKSFKPLWARFYWRALSRLSQRRNAYSCDYGITVLSRRPYNEGRTSERANIFCAHRRVALHS